MNWDQIFEQSGQEYIAHLTGLKESLDLLNKDKARTLGNYTEADAPGDVTDKIERDKKAWQKEWGIFGSRSKELVQKHQKQVYNEMRKEAVVKDLDASGEQKQEQKKQRGNGR